MQTAPTIRETKSSAKVLLQGLIDYAGLFPPASLSMAEAVANYDDHRRSEWTWVLGRFVLPVARLGELDGVFASLASSRQEAAPRSWHVSALIGPDGKADSARIREFNSLARSFDRSAGVAIDSVEVKVSNAHEIKRLAEIIPPDLTAYFEFPLTNSRECITALAGCGRRAKIRTGGETFEKFPSGESVIEFIRLCAEARLPFKATAGLHHPVRSRHNFTDQADSPSGVMHGFLNVFLAAAFLRAGMSPDRALELLEEQSPQAFLFDADGITWRDDRLNTDQLVAARQSFSTSFGSCSFTEPIADLRSLHLL